MFLWTHCVTIVSVKQRKEVIRRLIVLSKKLFPAKCKSAYSFLSTVRPQDSQSWHTLFWLLKIHTTSSKEQHQHLESIWCLSSVRFKYKPGTEPCDLLQIQFLSWVEITASRLEIKSCKGFFLKKGESTQIYNRSHGL